MKDIRQALYLVYGLLKDNIPTFCLAPPVICMNKGSRIKFKMDRQYGASTDLPELSPCEQYCRMPSLS